MLCYFRKFESFHVGTQTPFVVAIDHDNPQTPTAQRIAQPTIMASTQKNVEERRSSKVLTADNLRESRRPTRCSLQSMSKEETQLFYQALGTVDENHRTFAEHHNRTALFAREEIVEPSFEDSSDQEKSSPSTSDGNVSLSGYEYERAQAFAYLKHLAAILQGLERVGDCAAQIQTEGEEEEQKGC